jgi:hypothetical protein
MRAADDRRPRARDQPGRSHLRPPEARSVHLMHPAIRRRLFGQRAARRLGAAALAGLLVLAVAAPAFAHEERDLAGGYAIEVGLIAEPVFVAARSGLELHVTKDDQPISGLEQTLKAEVIYRDAKRDLPLIEREAEPGWYESIFIPTVAGKYTFHISGTIEGTAVDESFTSSPTGFNEVQEATSGQFPVTLPTTAELAAQARKGADAASQVTIALVLGGAGLVAGLLGLGVGLAGRRRTGA